MHRYAILLFSIPVGRMQGNHSQSTLSPVCTWEGPHGTKVNAAKTARVTLAALSLFKMLGYIPFYYLHLQSLFNVLLWFLLVLWSPAYVSSSAIPMRGRCGLARGSQEVPW